MAEEFVIRTGGALQPGPAQSASGPVFLHIKDGRFANVTCDAGKAPASIPLIDESDKFAIPGLIDTHVHMARFEPGADINLAPLYLAHGVTSVRDAGSDLESIKQMRSRIEEGAVPGPRIFFCGPQLNGKSFRPGMVNIQTEAEGREKVRELRDQGVHAIKVYDQLAPEVARAVIAEASELGLPVCGHLGRTIASEAISFGISTIEHLTSLVFELLDQERPNPFSQDVFKRMAELDLDGADVQRLMKQAADGGTYIDPTLVVYDRIARSDKTENWSSDIRLVSGSLASYWSDRMGGFVKTWSPADFAAARAALEKLKQVVKLLHDRGARLIAGTDTPNPYLVPGRSLVEEIKLLAEAGLPARAALAAATEQAADALGNDELGRIENGKAADFLLLGENPLEDMSSLGDVQAVFKSGARHSPEILRGLSI